MSIVDPLGTVPSHDVTAAGFGTHWYVAVTCWFGAYGPSGAWRRMSGPDDAGRRGREVPALVRAHGDVDAVGELDRDLGIDATGIGFDS